MFEFPGTWTPEIGQRVRVLPRPECFYCRSGEGENGVEGSVFKIEPPRMLLENGGYAEPGAMAHTIWVQLDVEVDNCDISHFAPIELEPTHA